MLDAINRRIDMACPRRLKAAGWFVFDWPALLSGIAEAAETIQQLCDEVTVGWEGARPIEDGEVDDGQDD